MLRNLNIKGQAVMGEYAMVIFLVIAVMTGMTIYFKRAVQARLFDAREYMLNEVEARAGATATANLYREYEPYYANTAAGMAQYVNDEIRLLPAASSGIFQKDFNQTRSVAVNSETAPPRDFD